MILLEEIPTVNSNYTLLQTRKILKIVYQDEVFKSLSEFYLMNVTLDNGGKLLIYLEKYEEKHDSISSNTINNASSKSKSKKSKSIRKQKSLTEITSPLTFKNYDLKLLNKVYLNFLYLINFSFDCGSSLDETQFLSDILKREQIIKILHRVSLKLSIRIEFIKFYRMVYLEFIIDKTKSIQYYSVLVNPINMHDQSGVRIENGEYYKLLHGLISVRDGSTNLDPDFDNV